MKVWQNRVRIGGSDRLRKEKKDTYVKECWSTLHVAVWEEAKWVPAWVPAAVNDTPLPMAVQEAVVQTPVEDAFPIAVREEVISVPATAKEDALHMAAQEEDARFPALVLIVAKDNVLSLAVRDVVAWFLTRTHSPQRYMKRLLHTLLREEGCASHSGTGGGRSNPHHSQHPPCGGMGGSHPSFCQ